MDDNKRLAWAATRVFCLLNDCDLDHPVDDAESLVLAAAAGKVDVADLARSMRPHL